MNRFTASLLSACFLAACGVTETQIEEEELPPQSITGELAVPSGFTGTTFVSGLNNPTAMTFAPDGRLFVAEQGGAVRVVKDGVLLTAPFVRLTVDSRGERGVLGLAFDPAFATNGFVYVYYTATTPRVHNRISRFVAVGDVARAGSETVLLDLNDLSAATNHNGGALHFGPDGKLYAAVGENANRANAQVRTNLLGKMLRLNADGTTPTDNPFLGTTTGKNQLIWAMGLRNPFTFGFQPGTGRMFINDVGENTWEEINEGRAGANYGWPNVEGQGTDPRFVNPLFTYGHGETTSTGCSIAGAAFYDPATPTFSTTFRGRFFFADACGGWIRSFTPSTGRSTLFATGISFPVDLKVGADGALYYLERGTNSVGRIQANTALPRVAPSITTQPANVTVATGAPATFSVVAAGSPTLTFQWRRNGVAITGATQSTLRLPAVSAADDGASFSVVVRNTVGSVTSATAVLRVTTQMVAAPVITTQPANVTVAAGSPAQFSVGATGTGLAFQWRRNGVAITGATAATFSLAATTTADDAASFTVVVSNGGGSVTSSAAVLRVTAVMTPAVSFRRDVQPILSRACTGCHGGSGGLSLEGAGVVANLARASSCNPNTRRVVPSNPQQSLLWQKLNGTPTCGGAMPRGTQGLKFTAPADFATIEAWISQGALDN